MTTTTTCPACAGTGETERCVRGDGEYEPETCPRCGGSGLVGVLDPRGYAPLKDKPIPLTISQLIGRLESARKQSPLKGRTCVFLSEPEIEYRPIADTFLEADDNGAVFLINTQEKGD